MKVSLAGRKIFVVMDLASFLLQRKAHVIGAGSAGGENLALQQGSFVGFAMALMLDPVDP